jgi:hypothetical protein
MPNINFIKIGCVDVGALLLNYQIANSFVESLLWPSVIGGKSTFIVMSKI